MAGTTKKQHYVPRCYLKRWTNSKGQVLVFDKSIKSQRLNSINDVACERYFYDINPRQLSEIRSVMLKNIGIDPQKDSQFLEHFLATRVEVMFSELLTKIIKKAEAATPWHIRNCYFISDSDKIDFSICLAFQQIRTKAIRTDILNSSDCLSQVLKDMSVPQKIIDQYSLDQGIEKNIHNNMILDFEKIVDIAGAFYGLTWVLGINRTDKLFYTSDNPIGRKAHITHPFLSMAGLTSKGVEIFFPISPQHILIMYDGSYHKGTVQNERNYVNLIYPENIDYYNSLCADQSHQCVFLLDEDLNVINKMLNKNTCVFDIPKTVVMWGGKKYYPQSKNPKVK
ncbi:MAG: DUF4238 domain-containing protein [Clostridiales bacterium]|nr:DUF4238 domain-containing protein [Clostridiales bacterium]